MNYKFIVDPTTGKKEYTRSKKGRHILFKYLNQVGGAEAAPIVWEQEGRPVEAVDLTYAGGILVSPEDITNYIAQAENISCRCRLCMPAIKKIFARENVDFDNDPYGYSQGIEHPETAEDLGFEELELSNDDIAYISAEMGDFICSRETLCQLVSPYLSIYEKKNTISEKAFQSWIYHNKKLKDNAHFRRVVECFLKFYIMKDFRCEAKPSLFSSLANLFK